MVIYSWCRSHIHLVTCKIEMTHFFLNGAPKQKPFHLFLSLLNKIYVFMNMVWIEKENEIKFNEQNDICMKYEFLNRIMA